jgi:WD40 repeat protein
MASTSWATQKTHIFLSITQKQRKLLTLGKHFQFLITIPYRPGHEGSIKNGAMDPLGEFVATIGCDGQLHIYKLPTSDNEDVVLVKKLKVV